MSKTKNSQSEFAEFYSEARPPLTRKYTEKTHVVENSKQLIPYAIEVGKTILAIMGRALCGCVLKNSWG